MQTASKALVAACSAALGLAAIDAFTAMLPANEHWTWAYALRATLHALGLALVLTVPSGLVLAAAASMLKLDVQRVLNFLQVALLVGLAVMLRFDMIDVAKLLGEWLARGLGVAVLSALCGFAAYSWKRAEPLLALSGLIVAAATVVVWIGAYAPGGWATAALVAAPTGLGLWRTIGTGPSRSGALVATATVLTVGLGLWVNFSAETHFSSNDLRPSIGRAAGPPILLLTVDTLRRDALSVYNPDAHRTPGFEELAADSLVYDRAYSAASWTLPSATTFLTGLTPLQHDMSNGRWRLPAEVVTLGERMSQAGYRTGAAVENIWLRRKAGFHRGFEKFAHYPRTIESMGSLYEWQIGLNSTQTLTWLALDWMGDRADQPFFFWLHFYDPHANYDPAEGGLEVGALDYAAHKTSEDPLPSERHMRGEKGRYLGEVREVDREISKLLAGLRELGLYDRMAIVMTVDHGEEFWDHGAWAHGQSLYNELVNVPLMIKPPSDSNTERQPGRDVEPISTRRVTSMVLELAGVEASDPCLERFSGDQDVPIRSRHDGGRAEALIVGDEKVVRMEGESEVLIYDLVSDPRERSPRPATPEEQAEYGPRLDARHAIAAEVRRCLGLDVEEETPAMSDDALKRLRDLGYVQ